MPPKRATVEKRKLETTIDQVDDVVVKKPKPGEIEAMKKAIKSKPDWYTKVRVQGIRVKWVSEAVKQGVDEATAWEVFQSLFDESMNREKYDNNFVGKKVEGKLDEDEDDYDDDYEGDFYVQEGDPETSGPNSNICYCDGIVPDILRDSLRKQLDFIANNEEKDFHPGAEGKVQGNIVSKDSSTEGDDSDKEKDGEEDEEDEDDDWGGEDQSDEFQKLANKYFPGLSHREKKERLREFMDFEYSNSLAIFTESHLKLYSKIEKSSNSVYQWLPAEFSIDKNGVVSIDRDFESLFSLFIPMFQKIGIFPADDDVMDVVNNNNNNNKMFSMSKNYGKNYKQLYAGRYQVIVKAANYLLEPGQEYEGTWHVEGTPNEHIIGSGIYYYHVDKSLEANNQLAFRKKKDTTYGDRANAAQSLSVRTNLGAVDTLEGRCLVFANHLQHKVRKMKNETDHQVLRKIICFFVVDPSRRVHSSLDVPQQQWDKISPSVKELVRKIFLDKVNVIVPEEVLSIIISYAKWGFTSAEAEQHRLNLMKERKYFVDANNELHEREYSFCEH